MYLRALPPCSSESHTRAMRYLYARDGVWRVHTKACSRLKRLKTGVQWKELPIEVYFEKGEISWQNVYYYFNKWSKDGSFQRIWLNLLSKKKRKLDMSCVQLDGSHTRCRQKGESTGYQARKKSVTTNSIFLCDNKGQMIAMGSILM